MTTTGLAIGTTDLLGGVSKTAAQPKSKDKVKIAYVGIGNRGQQIIEDFARTGMVEVVALCDVDLDGKQTQKVQGMYPKAKKFRDFREMFDKAGNEFDAVAIAIPDHTHFPVSMLALAEGKHVYVEKPIANSIAECDAMVKAAERYERVVQVGQQQRSGEHWSDMKRFIDGGTLGKIARVDVWANFTYGALGKPVMDTPVPEGVDFDMWLGPAPERTFNAQRFHGSWRMFWDYGGGLLTDWGVHLLDMALWGMNVSGMPKRVMASGGRWAYPENVPETFDTLSVVYEYDNFQIRWSNLAGTETGPYNRNYGLAFQGTNGTLVINREGWEVIPDGKKMEPFVGKADFNDHRKHVDNFLECVKSRFFDTACTIQNGSLCAKYAHLGNISARTGETLCYNDAKHTFKNKEADRLIRPDYRSPWRFPDWKD